MKSTNRVLAIALALSGCFSNVAETGEVHVTATGEEAAVEGYPTSTGIAFVDGWSLSFDHVFVSIREVRLGGEGGDTPFPNGAVIVDLHDGTADLFRESVPAQRYSDVGYRIAPATADAVRRGSVSEPSAAEMIASRYGIWLVGTATHATHGSVELDLGVPMDVVQSHCVNETDMTDGIVVPVNGTAEALLTFHLDHFFFDSIIAEEPNVRFEAYAAMATDDGVVTYDDLAGQVLSDMVGVDGEPLVDEDGNVILYDPGSTPLPMQNLREFIHHQATTVGHFNGEGHCEYEITPVE